MIRIRALRSRLAGPARRNWGLAALVCAAIPYLAVVTLLHTRAVSPIDEWVYLDYMQKFPMQGFVHEGERMSEESLEQMACVGVTPYGPIGPPCDNALDGPIDEFPNQGLSTASPYTPVYFAVTWVTGGALQVLPGVDLLDGWRLSGLLWFIGSAIVLFRLFKQFGIAQGPALVIGLAYLGSPYSWWTYTYVGTDAPSVLIGGLLLTLAVDLARGRHVGVLLAVIGIIGTTIKLTNAIGVALALLYLGIVALRRIISREPGWLRLLSPSLASLVVGIAIQILWMRIVAGTAVSDVRPVQNIDTTLDLPELLLQTTNFLPGTITSNPLGAFLPGFVYAPLSWLCVAGVLGSIMFVRARQPSSSMVVAVALASVIAAPLLAIALQIVTSSYFQLPPRYGATILPGLLLLVGMLVRSRAGAIAIGAYAGAILIVGVWLSAFLAALA